MATALKFDASTDRAPRITAQGQGELADLILRKAKEHGRQVVEDSVMAEALAGLPVGAGIPEPLFRGVAAIFAMVYDLERERAGKRGSTRTI